VHAHYRCGEGVPAGHVAHNARDAGLVGGRSGGGDEKRIEKEKEKEKEKITYFHRGMCRTSQPAPGRETEINGGGSAQKLSLL
jgi:hypothetical protein